MELNEHVLHAATAFFGVVPGGPLNPVHGEARDFLLRQHQPLYDVIMMDVAVDVGSGLVLSPPPEFLEPHFVEHGLRGRLAPGGCVAINVVGGGGQGVLQVALALARGGFDIAAISAAVTPTAAVVFAGSWEGVQVAASQLLDADAWDASGVLGRLPQVAQLREEVQQLRAGDGQPYGWCSFSQLKAEAGGEPSAD